MKVANQAHCQSRRVRGLSLESVEPSSRRRRSNIAGEYHPVVSDAAERDPPLALEGFVVGSGVGSERSTPLTSRFLFPREAEEEVEVEEVPQSPESLPSPLPSDSPFVF